MNAQPRLLVVSHPAVLPINQLVYAELVERGWQVDAIVPDRWRHEYGEIVPEPLPTLAGGFHPLPVIAPGRPQRHAYRVRCAAVLRRLKPHAVFLEQEPFSVAALQWGLAAHRAGVVFGVQAAENRDRRLRSPAEAWRSWVLRHAAFVAARSARAVQLVQRWGATGAVRLVPHHVPRWRTPVRQESRRFRVGYAGRLVPEKGLDVLVDAVRRLGADVELVVAGDGPLREWLQSAELGGATLRLMTGLAHGDMPAVYAGMDVLVLPSRTTERWSEQFGRVLVEALWCGLPVVGSDSGEIPWVIAATGGGRVVPEGQAQALADVLEELRGDVRQRRTLAERGRQAVERTFSVPAVAKAMDDMLRSAVGDTRPRVALVAHGVHDHGGMERACAELIKRSHHEFAYTVIAAELAPELRTLVSRWIRVGVPMRPIPVKFLAFFLSAGLALRRLNVDLIHTVGAIVPNRIDLTSIQFCHAGHRAATGRLAPAQAPLERRLNTALVRILAMFAERWCYRPTRIRSFSAVSEGVAAEVAAHYPGIPVVLTPNGIDPDRFHPDPHERRRTRSNQGVAPSHCIALFVGGDWDHKGLSLAIEAVAKVRDTGTQLALWVVGPGDENRLAALAGTRGVRAAVSFFGRRDDTERFYQAADIFVLPSAYETFSIVCFEAAACGLPIVIPPLYGAGELVGDDEAGVIVERDANSVAQALLTLAIDRELRLRLGTRAAQRALSFTWESSAQAVTRAYASLLSRAGTVRCVHSS